VCRSVVRVPPVRFLEVEGAIMEQPIEGLKRELERARQTIRAQERRIADLREEVADLQRTLASLQEERPEPRPEALIPSFKTILQRMHEGPLNLRLPRPGHVFPVDSLSTVRCPPAPRTVEVPNLIEMDRAAAAGAVRAARLRVGEIVRRASATAPGRVIDQHPDPLTRTEPGTPVKLIVSKAKETQVPDLIGLERERAAAMVAAAHLTLGDVREEISGASPGTVIRQGIQGGAVVPFHTALTLTIARPETTSVPDLIGATIHRARRRVARARLEVADVARKPSKEPPDTVIRQRPDAGQQVAVTTSVQLVVARPRLATVPYAHGMDRGEALEAIEGAGLAIGELIHEASDQPPGTVVGLEPEPGTELEPGSEVTVRVSRS
jgi:beta-lactam-binding protein with PASTA domain